MSIHRHAISSVCDSIPCHERGKSSRKVDGVARNSENSRCLVSIWGGGGGMGAKEQIHAMFNDYNNTETLKRDIKKALPICVLA